jgi:hypothetical protein
MATDRADHRAFCLVLQMLLFPSKIGRLGAAARRSNGATGASSRRRSERSTIRACCVRTNVVTSVTLIKDKL